MPGDDPTRQPLPQTLRQLVQLAPAVDVHIDADLADLIELADLHGVKTIVRDRLRHHGGTDADLRLSLDAAVAETAASQLRALADLDTASRALASGGVGWLVMKGPASAELLWDRPELREYTDVDLLVRPADLGTALEHLEGEGFSVLERNWTMLLHRRRGQVHLRGPQTTLIDLHWDLIAEGEIRDQLRVDTVSMIERSLERQIGRTMVRVLDDVDRMLHLGLHGSLSGGHRLIWLKDIEAAAIADGLDWEAVVVRARRFRIDPLLWLMLYRTNAVLSPTPIPDDVVEALRPPPLWRWTVQLADSWTGHIPMRDASLRKTVGRSTRATPTASWAELVRSGTSWVWSRLRGHPPSDLADPENPGSMLFESGGEEGRRRYVEWVAGQQAG